MPTQEMLRELPERNDETTQQLTEESRCEAMRWAADEIQREFKEASGHTGRQFQLAAREWTATRSATKDA